MKCCGIIITMINVQNAEWFAQRFLLSTIASSSKSPSGSWTSLLGGVEPAWWTAGMMERVKPGVRYGRIGRRYQSHIIHPALCSLYIQH